MSKTFPPQGEDESIEAYRERKRRHHWHLYYRTRNPTHRIAAMKLEFDPKVPRDEPTKRGRSSLLAKLKHLPQSRLPEGR